MYSFACPVCLAYIADLDLCDCGCGQYVCDACGAVFVFQETEINQVLYRNGIYSDLLAVTTDDGDLVSSPAFRDAETYKRFVEWNAIRMGAAVDQIQALLCDDSEDDSDI